MAMASTTDECYLQNGDFISFEVPDVGFLETDRFAGSFGPDPVTFVAHNSASRSFRRTCVFTVSRDHFDFLLHCTLLRTRAAESSQHLPNCLIIHSHSLVMRACVSGARANHSPVVCCRTVNPDFFSNRFVHERRPCDKRARA